MNTVSQELPQTLWDKVFARFDSRSSGRGRGTDLGTAELKAVRNSYAVIEFDANGVIQDANQIFCRAMGYQLEEIVGQHHRIFVDPAYATSQDYANHWSNLRSGLSLSGDYERRAKGGEVVWIRASYMALKDDTGTVVRVIKYATDITSDKQKAQLKEAELSCLRDSQAVIEFEPDGTIITANDIFCSVTGYALSEIQGKHHQIFVDPDYAKSREYEDFWRDLGRGTANVGDFKRFGKSGEAVWIRASYNPVRDQNGAVVRVVKYAADITAEVAQREAAEAEAVVNMRLKQALDQVTANVMVADAENNIQYLNTTVTEMMRIAQDDIRKELPEFDVSKLVGQNIDVFHKNPAHQRGMLAALRKTHRTEIGIGGRRFGLIANPVWNEEGERIGTVVEWSDVTAERLIEKELGNVVEAAVQGDFSQRVDLDGKDGFMLSMAEGVNTFAETCQDGLNDVAHMMSKLAEGDLTVRMTKEYSGLFEELKENANGTAEKLAQVLTQITLGSGEVLNASSEIATGSADLSQRTEEQASTLEQTASAMEEMAQAVKANADNAIEANNLGKGARKVAERGGEVVQNAVGAMAQIEESSQKISDIISVIDEIAFQTNLLALNAAVEAARAGEAGKGFAVVASEVRALAQRSSEAAKDIKSLINDSSNQVKSGVELVNEAGGQLTEIVDSIKSVTDLISEIASANQQQSTGIEEINRSVAEMDEMTQQNSALVEETAASARALEEQSSSMRDRVSFFQLGEGEEQGYSDFSTHGAAKSRSGRNGAKAVSAAVANAALSRKSTSSSEDWSEF